MVTARRTLVGLVLAVAFGVAVAVVKGDHAGLRGGLGNLSGPWLLVAFLPALRCRRLAAGAVTGLLSTLAALLGFYATLTVVLAGHLGAGGYGEQLLVESQANRVYFAAGIITGPLLGAMGAWVGRRRPVPPRVVVGVILAAEVLVVAVASGHQLAPPPLYFRWGVDDWRPYLLESAVGVAVLLSAGPRRARHPSPRTRPRGG
jgi:hypothetical protein